MLKRIALSWPIPAGIIVSSLILLFFLKLIGLPVIYIFKTKAFKIYLIVALVYALLFLSRSIWLRRIPSAILSVVMILMIILFFIKQNTEFHAFISGVEGLRLEDYYSVEMGRWSKVPQLPVMIEKIEDDNILLKINGQKKKLYKEESFNWENYRITLKGIDYAPLVILKDRQGNEIDSFYVKVKLKGNRKDYFQFPAVPYRFYLSYPQKQREYWRQTEKGWERLVKPYEKEEGDYHLIIMKEKLVVFEGDIKINAEIFFETYRLNIQRGRPWAEFEIQKKGLSLF